MGRSCKSEQGCRFRPTAPASRNDPIRFTQASLVVEAAAAGRGIALAKRAIAAADLERGRLIAPFADGSSEIDFAYWVVWPKWRTPSKLARTFMAWLREEAAAEEVVGV